MLEFEIQSPRHVRLRVGHWHIRTWRSHVHEASKGYRSPEPCYSVEHYDAEGKNMGQFGAFFSMEAAEACLAQLESEGRTGLGINLIPVHVRIEDWQFDR